MRRHKWMGRVISVLLIISLITGAFLFSFTPAMAGEEIYIQVGDDLTAVISEDGTLRLEGMGGSYDYTADSAPFLEYADRITRVVIPEGVTYLGDCLFYGCHQLGGSLELPVTLVELGDKVFSGRDPSDAPRFTYIFNDFVSCDEVVSPSAEPSESVEPSAAPSAEPNGEPIESAPPGVEPTTTPDGEPSIEPSPSETPSPEETPATPSPTDVPTAEPTVAPSPNDEPSAAPGVESTVEPGAVPKQTATPEPTATPAPSGETEQGGASSGEDAAAIPAPEATPEAVITDEPVAAAPVPDVSAAPPESALPSEGVEQSESAEPTTEPEQTATPEASAAPTAAPSPGAEPSAAPDDEPGVGPNAAPSDEPSVEPSNEPTAVPGDEPGDTAEPTGSAEPSENTAPTEPTAGAEPAPQPTELYKIDTVYQQRVGSEIFYPADSSGQTGLYLCTPENLAFAEAVEAAGYAPADGEIELHLIPGEGEGAPTAVRALHAGGYVAAPDCPFAPPVKDMVFAGWITSDGEELYAAGDSIAVDGETGALALCAFWGEGLATLEAGTGEVTFNPGAGSGTPASMPCEMPLDGGGMSTYARWPEDFGFTAPTEIVGESKPDEINNFTSVIVFDGWEGSDGSTYDPGDLVPEGTTLTAKWAWARVVYMSEVGSESGKYTLDKAMQAFCTREWEGFERVWKLDTSKGYDDKYRNIIVVDTDASLRLDGTWFLDVSVKLPQLPCTITSLEKKDAVKLNMDATYSSSGYRFTFLAKPTVFRDITLAASHRDNLGASSDYCDGFFANCQKLIMGRNITVNGNLNIFGGAGGGLVTGGVTGGADVAIFSGGYQRVYGGSFRATMNDSRSLRFIGGTAGRLYGGGYQKGNTTSGESKVYMFGGSVTGDVAASSDQGQVTGNSSLIMTGGSVGGSVFGGVYGAEGNTTSLMNGSTSVTILGGSVTGSVYGGGNVSPLTGGAAVNIRAGSVGGSVYGGGNAAAVTGNTSVAVSDGIVSGSVYGGGKSTSATVTGNTRVEVIGGSVSGSVYGGGEKASVENSDATNGGSTNVSMLGGQVHGNIYGGGMGDSLSNEVAAVSRATKVTIAGGTVGVQDLENNVINGDVYGGGQQARVGRSGSGIADVTSEVDISGGDILGSVYGGSYCGMVGVGTVNTNEAQADTIDVGGSSSVRISNNSTVGGDVFGGGNGIGSGAGLGAVFGNSSVEISGGTVGNRVFGGSSMARIAGNTSVSVTSDTGEVKIAQTIYAGCNGKGTTFDEKKFLVFGNSSVSVEKTANAVTIGGSIFGSGNLTRVKGTRTLSVKNLIGEIDSLQRAHTVTIVDSNLTLTGAGDKVDGTNLNFSMAQVAEEVKLINSQLTARTGLNEVNSFGSYNEDGTPDTSGKNVLTILAGRLLAFGTTSTEGGVHTFTYGPVEGVTTLRWTAEKADDTEQGVFVHASAASDTGDGTGNTGAFIAESGEDKPFVSGKVGNSYSYWRLGNNAVTHTVTLKLEDTEKDAAGYYEDVLPIRLHIAVPADTEFVAIDPDVSSFSPVLTKDGDQSFSLDVKQGTDDQSVTWHGTTHTLYIVNANGTAEFVCDEEQHIHPVTETAGVAQFDIKLRYKDEYMAGGRISFTLLARPQSDESDTGSLGRFTVVVEIIGRGKGSSYGRAMAGRQYERFYSQNTPTPTIGSTDAVTVQVVLNYTPELDEGDTERAPILSIKDGEGNPVSTNVSVLMADLSLLTAPKWYKGTMSGGSIRANQLDNVRGNGMWKPPLKGQAVVDKSLLFLLDFRNSPIAPGNYFFSLEFPTGSCVTCEVPFVVAEQSAAGTIQWSEGNALTVTAPEGDQNYLDGSLVRITGINGMDVGQIRAKIGTATQSLISGDGAVFLRLLTLTQGRTVTVNWTFPAVGGDTAITAELFPLPKFQTGTLGTAAPSSEMTLTGTGGQTHESTDRAIVVTLTSGERVVSSATGGSLSFEITLDKVLDDGERIEAKVLKKTEYAPEAASYTEEVAGCTYTPSDNYLTGTLTLPAGMEPGTYRINFRLVGADGAVLTEYPFNVIVSE